MENRGTGWIRDQSDKRDYTLQRNEVAAVIKKVEASRQFIKLLDKLPEYLNISADHAPKAADSEDINGILKQLRINVEVMVADLVSGIDLVTADPWGESYGPMPSESDRLSPPVATELIEIVEAERARAGKEKSLSQILEAVVRRFAPIGALKQSINQADAKAEESVTLLSSLEAAWQQEQAPMAAASNTVSSSYRQENIIYINPDTMHQLEEEKFVIRLPITPQLVETKLAPQQASQNKRCYLVLPSVVDLSYWCSPIKDQAETNACTVFAATSLVEYFQMKSTGSFTPRSTRFLYKVARRMGEASLDYRERIQQFVKVQKPSLSLGLKIEHAPDKSVLAEEQSSTSTKMDIPVADLPNSLAPFYPRNQPRQSSLLKKETFLEFRTDTYAVRLFQGAQGRLMNVFDRQLGQLLVSESPTGYVPPTADSPNRFGYAAFGTFRGKQVAYVVYVDVEPPESVTKRQEEINNKLISHVSQRHKTQSMEFKQAISPYLEPDKVDDFILQIFDMGASIRQTMKALQLFGIPPSKYWPDTPDLLALDEEPLPFCYAFASNYQAMKYFRLDFLNKPELQLKTSQAEEEANVPEEQSSDQERIFKRRQTILIQIKAVLAAGFPAVFGFPYDASLEDSNTGEIRMPNKAEKAQLKKDLAARAQLGHAVLAVGYDDEYVIGEEQGAFLIQNSWGKEWGKDGYGWLPYAYLLEGLATDWWSLLSTEWVESGEFGVDNQMGGRRKTRRNW